MITLSNIFSREKTLFYFTMWNDSDRMGFLNFLGHKVKHNLFIIPPVGQKGSVWYSHEELGEIDTELRAKLLDPVFESKILETLDGNWPKLKEIFDNDEKVQTGDDLMDYYQTLIIWWSAMTTIFNVSDMDDAPADFRQKMIMYRSESEKYTERMNHVFVDFWLRAVPENKDLAPVLLPEEAASISKGEMSQEEIENKRERLKGCFMYDRKIYPLSELGSFLKEKGLVLEEIKTEEVEEIKGRPAQIGKAKGTVKIIRVKADLVKIQNGDIMVTEMTNPDYVPYMKVAGAIVTDEGGTTCHAAIASRELKVPCIVGTKIATKVLKDGDMVEVDAERGIVTKL